MDSYRNGGQYDLVSEQTQPEQHKNRTNSVPCLIETREAKNSCNEVQGKQQ